MTPSQTADEPNSNGLAESPFLPQIQRAEQRIAEFNDKALVFIRARPVTCVVGALTLGFIVGKIAARI